MSHARQAILPATISKPQADPTVNANPVPQNLTPAGIHNGGRVS